MKKIKKGECRYKNLETYETLEKFERTGKINFEFKEIDETLETNIVKWNKTKNKIDKKFSNGINIGNKVILLEHYEGKGFFKGYMFNVETIEGEIINDIIKLKDIQLNYATTSHKFQGKTINEEYNIFDGKRHSKETFYTSLSRTTDIKNIHLNKLELKNEYKSEYQKMVFNEIINENLIGEIYVVYCDKTGYWYIGMTLRNNQV